MVIWFNGSNKDVSNMTLFKRVKGKHITPNRTYLDEVYFDMHGEPITLGRYKVTKIVMYRGTKYIICEHITKIVLEYKYTEAWLAPITNFNFAEHILNYGKEIMVTSDIDE